MRGPPRSRDSIAQPSARCAPALSPATATRVASMSSAAACSTIHASAAYASSFGAGNGLSGARR